MSDYLTNLVARNLNSAPAIQPRLLSLFEPLSGPGPIFPTPAPAAEQFESVVAAEDDVAQDDSVYSRAAQQPETESTVSPATVPLIINQQSRDNSNATGSFGPVSVQTTKPEPAPIKPVATELRKEEESINISVEIERDSKPDERDHSRGDEQVEPLLQVSPEARSSTFLPVIGVRVETQASQHDVPVKISQAIENEVSVSRTKTESLSRASANVTPKIVAPITDLRSRQDTSQPEYSSATENVFAPATRSMQTTRPENQSSTRYDSESLNQLHAAEVRKAPSPDDEHIQSLSLSPTLMAPRAAIETIRAERVSQPPTRGPAAVQETNARKPISDMNSRRAFRPDKRNKPADESNRPESQPTINVTIGRVEVRASLPAVSRSTVRNSESPKLMGLDDYLRQRALGGKQ